MLMETWDTDRIGNQQQIFGRHKEAGSPLTGTGEFDTPDFSAKDDKGKPVIDPLSHVALAARENNDGIMIRRRSYNYTDGLDAEGQLNAGLLFVSYQNNPAKFHPAPESAWRARPSQRVHPSHRLGHLRRAARP